jgi:hypothetical protein
LKKHDESSELPIDNVEKREREAEQSGGKLYTYSIDHKQARCGRSKPRTIPQLSSWGKLAAMAEAPFQKTAACMEEAVLH